MHKAFSCSFFLLYCFVFIFIQNLRNMKPQNRKSVNAKSDLRKHTLQTRKSLLPLCETNESRCNPASASDKPSNKSILYFYKYIEIYHTISLDFYLKFFFRNRKVPRENHPKNMASSAPHIDSKNIPLDTNTSHKSAHVHTTHTF